MPEALTVFLFTVVPSFLGREGERERAQISTTERGEFPRLINRYIHINSVESPMMENMVIAVCFNKLVHSSIPLSLSLLEIGGISIRSNFAIRF